MNQITIYHHSSIKETERWEFKPVCTSEWLSRISDSRFYTAFFFLTIGADCLAYVPSISTVFLLCCVISTSLVVICELTKFDRTLLCYLFSSFETWITLWCVAEFILVQWILFFLKGDLTLPHALHVLFLCLLMAIGIPPLILVDAIPNQPYARSFKWWSLVLFEVSNISWFCYFTFVLKLGDPVWDCILWNVVPSLTARNLHLGALWTLLWLYVKHLWNQHGSNECLVLLQCSLRTNLGCSNNLGNPNDTESLSQCIYGSAQ